MKNSSFELMNRLKDVFPPLHNKSHKGQNGRIAVIGGSFQFTGAPYYAAISALKIGGDLSHIFCSKSASSAIKSYTPEVIVHPIFISDQEEKYNEIQVGLMHEEWLKKIKDWEKAIHSWVIGPGLGRDSYIRSFFPKLIKNLPNNCKVIFDADAIFFLCQFPELFNQLKRFQAILTPNKRELDLLKNHFKIDETEILKTYQGDDEITQIPNTHALEEFKLLIKREHDIILGKDRSFILRTQGGNKRCGGIGDILAGALSVCSFWDKQYGPVLAARLVKLATRLAFEKEGRSLTAVGVIGQLPQVVNRVQFSHL